MSLASGRCLDWADSASHTKLHAAEPTFLGFVIDLTDLRNFAEESRIRVCDSASPLEVALGVFKFFNPFFYEIFLLQKAYKLTKSYEPPPCIYYNEKVSSCMSAFELYKLLGAWLSW